MYGGNLYVAGQWSGEFYLMDRRWESGKNSNRNSFSAVGRRPTRAHSLAPPRR